MLFPGHKKPRLHRACAHVRSPAAGPSPPVYTMPAGDHCVTSSCPLAPHLLQDYISEQPGLLKQRDRLGQSLLHRAVHRESPHLEAVQILLRSGADPNAGDVDGVTPVHLACRKGRPDILYLLLHHGGEVRAEDTRGRGAVIHAAEAGSVLSMHYLSTVLGMGLRVVDREGNSPLHISCAHNHVSAVRYLLRKSRSDQRLSNSSGDTALEVAVRAGHWMACWVLLRAGGVALLHPLNRQGNSRMELVQRDDANNSQPRFKKVMHLLKHYSDRRDARPAVGSDGPRWQWLFLFALPVSIYLLGLAAACSYPEWSRYIIMLAIVIMLVTLGLQGHRMNHISRCANPMFMGFLLGAQLNRIICFYTRIFPTLEFCAITTIFATILEVINITLFCILKTIDPGQVKLSVNRLGSKHTIADIGTGTSPTAAFCQNCEIMTPPWTKHCKLCDACFADMDHHCLYLGRCIARRNHRKFLWFVLTIKISEVLFLSLGLASLQERNSPSQRGLWFAATDAWHVLKDQPWLFSSLLSAVISISWGIGFLAFHCYVIGKGHKTFFRPNFGFTKLSWFQRILNFVFFLLGLNPYADDPLCVPLTNYTWSLKPITDPFHQERVLN